MNVWRFCLSFACVLLCLFLGAYDVRPRGEVPYPHLERDVAFLSQHPRPVGSAIHDFVGNELLKWAQNTGFEVAVQETASPSSWGINPAVAYVRNILVRKKGTERGPALWLSAHYDSVMHSPGAADNVGGVAVVREILTRLAKTESRRDIVVVLVDGEERGLFGSQALVSRHPWFAGAGFVINLDARGSTGPVVLFEARGLDIAALIPLYERDNPLPFLYSFSQDIYRVLPNDTDLSVYAAGGKPGVNLGYFAKFGNYHTRFDSVRNLDGRSLRDLLDQAWLLTQKLMNQPSFDDLASKSDSRSGLVFFRVPFWNIIYFGKETLLIIEICAVVFFLIGLGWHKKRPCISRSGVLWTLACILSLCVYFGLLHMAAFPSAPKNLRTFYSLTMSESEFWGYCVVTCAFLGLLCDFFCRKIGGRSVAALAVCFSIVLFAASFFYLPGLAMIWCGTTVLGVLGLAARRRESRILGLLGGILGVCLLILSGNIAYLMFESVPQIPIIPSFLLAAPLAAVWLIRREETEKHLSFLWPSVPLLAVVLLGVFVRQRYSVIQRIGLWTMMDANGGDVALMSDDRAELERNSFVKVTEKGGIKSVLDARLHSMSGELWALPVAKTSAEFVAYQQKYARRFEELVKVVWVDKMKRRLRFSYSGGNLGEAVEMGFTQVKMNTVSVNGVPFSRQLGWRSQRLMDSIDGPWYVALYGRPKDGWSLEANVESSEVVFFVCDWEGKTEEESAALLKDNEAWFHALYSGMNGVCYRKSVALTEAGEVL